MIEGDRGEGRIREREGKIRGRGLMEGEKNWGGVIERGKDWGRK